MKGLELSRTFFDECVEPMLREQFPELLPYMAIGLTGQGSECYGFDDDISQDHDFEPGVIIFIPSEDVLQANETADGEVAGTPLVDSRAEFKLTRAYAALPKEILGYKRSLISPVGGARHGVMRMSDYWKRALGVDISRVAQTGHSAQATPGSQADFSSQATFGDGAVLSTDAWLRIPEYALAEATNGEIFRDDYGVMTALRKQLRRYPEDIRRKKLAGYLLLMQQAGEYNYPRCLAHGETAAAQLAIVEFVKAAMHVVFLLNNRYMPYYKWAFRAMRSLAMLAPLVEDFEHLLTTPNDGSTCNCASGTGGGTTAADSDSISAPLGSASAADKQATIARIIRDIVTVIELRGIVHCDATSPETASNGTPCHLCEKTSSKSNEDAHNDTTLNFEINLEQLAYKVNDTVKDAALRNEHILSGVE